MTQAVAPFEQIRRVNEAGNEFWSSRDFSRVLGYTDYRNFESVIESARTACFNSGHRVDDHFVEVTEMVEVGNLTKEASPETGAEWKSPARKPRKPKP